MKIKFVPAQCIEMNTLKNLEKLQEIENKYNIALVFDKNLIINKSIIHGICLTENCGTGFNVEFRIFLRCGCFCIECRKIKANERRKKTLTDKFGVENVMHLQKTKEKMKQTFNTKYGFNNPFESEKIKEKIKETNKAKYGVENLFESKQIKEKIKKTNKAKYGTENPMQCEKIREKTKKTNKAKYGTENPLQCEKIKAQIKETNKAKYGVDYPMQREEVREKGRKTNKLKYGVEYISQSEEMKQKHIKNSRQKYGTDHPMQHEDIFRKNQNARFKHKTYGAPNGEEFSCQGYEHFGLRDIFQDPAYQEKKNLVRTKKIPTATYTFQEKTHKYFPDIYIENLNLIVEIKSTYTMSAYKDRIFLKQNAMKALGYLCEIWVYNAKGTRIEIYP